ncbi:PE family protein, partial [Mycobacterium kansasii]
ATGGDGGLGPPNGNGGLGGAGGSLLGQPGLTGTG